MSPCFVTEFIGAFWDWKSSRPQQGTLTAETQREFKLDLVAYFPNSVKPAHQLTSVQDDIMIDCGRSKPDAILLA